MLFLRESCSVSLEVQELDNKIDIFFVCFIYRKCGKFICH